MLRKIVGLTRVDGVGWREKERVPSTCPDALRKTR